MFFHRRAPSPSRCRPVKTTTPFAPNLITPPALLPSASAISWTFSTVLKFLLAFTFFLPWNCLLFLSRLYTFEYKAKKQGVVEHYLSKVGISYSTVKTITDDGYNLTMQRLGSGPVPILFIHGMFESSAMTLAHGLHSLPIKLARDGRYTV